MNKLKLFAGACLLALTGIQAHAQYVLGYTMSEGAGTYTPLDSPTVIFDGATTQLPSTSTLEYNVFTSGSILSESGTAQGYPIGFDVDINGTSYSNFVVGYPGYVQLGNGEMNIQMLGNRWLQTETSVVAYGFSNRRGYGYDENTQISYKTVGSGDDQRLIVQFSHFGMQIGFWGDPSYVDIQLAIWKDGKVEFTFNNFANVGEDSSMPIYAGITIDANFVAASGTYGDDNFEMTRNSLNDSNYPSTMPNGSTLTFNVPTPCVVPSGQPTDMDLKSTSNTIEGSFVATDSADSYLVVYAPVGKTLAVPVDGTQYPSKSEYGEGKVAYYGDLTSFILYGLPGGVDYEFTAYAANSFGKGGPVYNTTNPLKANISTLPDGAKSIELTSATTESLTFDIVSNEADDDVVVIYNSYCGRDVYGDHGLFGELPADPKAGDVLPVAEDFTPPYEMEGAPMPENAGVIAYVGKAGELTLDNLKPSTGYYVGVYTRSANGNYTSSPLYGGATTNIEAPYTGDSYNFPRYRLPLGWTGSETSAEDGTVEFQDNLFFNVRTMEVSQGTQLVQQQARITGNSATEGKAAWVTPNAVEVNDRHLIAKFDYCLTFGASRFSTIAYNDWAENDELSLRISTDGGETWESLVIYTPENHPQQEETLSYVSIAADLNEYRGQTVLLQLYWKTYSVAAFGTTAYIDCFSVLQGEFPAVPEVAMGKITDTSAVVSWTSQQEDYQLVYNVKGADEVTVVTVKNSSTYTLKNLSPATEYEVMVRGKLIDENGEQTGWSEWSDPVEFTTAGYPAVDAPENLVADVETLEASHAVILSWDAVEDALSYQVAYRLSTDTEWSYVTSPYNSVIVYELEFGKSYIWKVSASCTHDRETEYSAQAKFDTPEDTQGGVYAVESENVSVKGVSGAIVIEGASSYSVYAASGVAVDAAKECGSSVYVNVTPGVYFVKTASHSFKVIVK